MSSFVKSWGADPLKSPIKRGDVLFYLMVSIGYEGSFPFSFVPFWVLISNSILSLFFFAVSSFYLFWSSINFFSIRWSLNSGIRRSLVRSFMTWEFFSVGDAFDFYAESICDLTLFDCHLCSSYSSSSLKTLIKSSLIRSTSFRFVAAFYFCFFPFAACCWAGDFFLF